MTDWRFYLLVGVTAVAMLVSMVMDWIHYYLVIAWLDRIDARFDQLEDRIKNSFR